MSTIPKSHLTEADADYILALVRTCRHTARQHDRAVMSGLEGGRLDALTDADIVANRAVTSAVYALVSARVLASGEAR